MTMTPNSAITRLFDNIYLIQAKNGSRYPFCNSFLFTGKVRVLIDAGIGEEMIRELDRKKRIDILIITHSHPDHMLGWHVLKDRHLLLPKETPDSTENLGLLGIRFTGESGKGAYWEKKVGQALGLHPLKKPNARFHDGTILKAGTSRIEAIHTPGHLDDHYCFFEHRSGLLLSTDIDFSGFGPWYGNPESDIEEFEKSIEKIMKMPYKMVCPSHKGPVIGDASDLFLNYLDTFGKHREMILSLCQPPRTLQQMISYSPFYKNRMRDKILQGIYEQSMITKNLELLIREGLVEEKYGQFRKIEG
ncbi:MBL fold metallo-hydrolase [Desulfobacterales bacterium HSG16]|nr:MBL fold metallo-hydrolase [Desulfobacterales bacterium HSG16]